MRVLILSSDYYPPFRVDVKVLFAEEMAKRGMHIDWILQSAAPNKKRFVETYGSGQVWVGPSTEPTGFFKRATRLIQGIVHDSSVLIRSRKNKYDIIQVKDKFVGGLIALMAAKLNRTKFVFWLSYPFPEAQRYTAKLKLARYPLINRMRGACFDFILYRVLLPSSDFIFVQSEQMKKDIVQRGVCPEKMQPIPMGITPGMLDVKPIPKLATHPTAVYLGTLIPIRRLDFILRAFSYVLEEREDAKLLMIGGPAEDIEPLKVEAARLGISDSVTFTGNLAQEAALNLTSGADVCLSPFFPTPVLNSTSPTKLIEYMALSRPVVANHHPEQTKVIAESGGGLCVDYSEQAFAEAILKIINNPALGVEMGRKGRAYAETRSYEHIADQLLNHYAQILNPPQSHT